MTDSTNKSVKRHRIGGGYTSTSLPAATNLVLVLVPPRAQSRPISTETTTWLHCSVFDIEWIHQPAVTTTVRPPVAQESTQYADPAAATQFQDGWAPEFTTCATEATGLPSNYAEPPTRARVGIPYLPTVEIDMRRVLYREADTIGFLGHDEDHNPVYVQVFAWSTDCAAELIKMILCPSAAEDSMIGWSPLSNDDVRQLTHWMICSTQYVAFYHKANDALLEHAAKIDAEDAAVAALASGSSAVAVETATDGPMQADDGDNDNDNDTDNETDTDNFPQEPAAQRRRIA